MGGRYNCAGRGQPSLLRKRQIPLGDAPADRKIVGAKDECAFHFHATYFMLCFALGGALFSPDTDLLAHDV